MVTKRFSSCFICDIEINDDDEIILTDSGKKCFYINKKTCSASTMKSFVSWFKNFYMRGIAQMITIVDYSIRTNDDGESIMVVNKLIPGEIPNRRCDD